MAVIEKRKGKDGKPVFRVKVRLKGHPQESATFDRKTDAAHWAQKRETEIREGRYFKHAKASKATLADLIERYLELELPKRRTNQTSTKTHLQWWREHIGHLLLQDISTSALSEARDRLLQSAVKTHKYSTKKNKGRYKSPATVVRYMASLSHAFSVAAKEWEWIEQNPMLKVKKPREPRGRVRFLSDDERDRLLKACKQHHCPYLYTVVVIALSTGARYSEILNLCWADIDLSREIAFLQKTKNQERRAMHLTHHALTLMKKLHADMSPHLNDFVFRRADGKKPKDVRKCWYEVVKKIGLKDFRFHDLRHSAASYLAMNGATLAEIAEVLGHKTLQMVMRYAHLSDQHTAKVVERMNRKIFAANDNDPDEEENRKAES